MANSKIPFTKLQTVGNDFILLEKKDIGSSNLEQLAKAMCERHYAIGADGLLVLDATLPIANLRMFNPDGTEDFCGNGLRCAAQYLFDLYPEQLTLNIQHGHWLATAHQSQHGITITMPTVSFDANEVPHKHKEPLLQASLIINEQPLKITSCNSGSTHTVIFCDNAPSETVFQSISPQIEQHELFPERTSILWIWPDANQPQHLHARIWERGVKETHACGTGAIAAVSAHLQAGGKPGFWQVTSKGGTLLVQANDLHQSFALSAQVKKIFYGFFFISLTKSTHTSHT